MASIVVKVKKPDGNLERSFSLNKGEKNLFAIIKNLFPEMQFKLDKKYGAEITEIAGLKKDQKAGIHFTINGMVPYEFVNGKKLYCAPYHIQVNQSLLNSYGGKLHIELELVSVCIDYPNSVIDPMLDFRSRNWALEPLLPLYFNFKNQRTDLMFMEFFLNHIKVRSEAVFQKEKLKEIEIKPNFINLQQKLQDLSAQKIESRDFYDSRGFYGFDILEEQLKIEEPLREITQSIFANQLKQKAEEKAKVVYQKHNQNVASYQSSKNTISTHSLEFYINSPFPKPIPLSSIKKLEAVIFDLDGVVVDTEKPHLETFNKVLAEFGVKITPYFWKRNYTGIGSAAILKDVFERHKIKADIDEVLKKRAEIYYEHITKNKLKPIDGFIEFFNYLRKNEIPIAIASGGHKPHILASMMAIGIPKVPFVGHEDVKNKKPAPDAFLLACQKLNVSPSQSIVFEDSLAGLKAAAFAKIPSVALCTTIPAKELKGKASLVVKNFKSTLLKKVFSKLLKRN